MEDVPCKRFTELSDEFRAETHGMPLLNKKQKMSRNQADVDTLDDIGNGQTIPMVYLITTTYRRDTQKADLVVLCQTLMHVQSLVWILVENSMQHTPMIGALLKRCGLPYVHLTVSSPDHTYVRATSEIVGIQHRNVGLKWIREHCGNGKCNSGVVYFGDDDDRYDLRLFDEIRNTDTISVFMVGLTGGLLMEGPYCKKGKIQMWHHVWGNSRHIPVDMQGFAINLRLVLRHTDIWLEGSDIYNSMGYTEASRFIFRFLPHTTLYCGTYNDENCPCGQFHSIHHNELRDITALLTEVCHALRNRTLPTASNPLSGEQLKYKTADGARLDVVAENIWSKNRLKAFFDVKVFNPFSKSYANTPLAQCHRHLEQDKRSLSLRLTVLIPSTVNSKSS
ncbi:hypothetical protein EMCRGX_G007580 [Ephydatia muelleri]